MSTQEANWSNGPMTTYTYEFMDADDGDGPEDEDYVIGGQPSAWDTLGRYNGAYIGSFEDRTAICAAIMTHMDSEQYFPNVWYVNERGSVDLCRIVRDTEAKS